MTLNARELVPAHVFTNMILAGVLVLVYVTTFLLLIKREFVALLFLICKEGKKDIFY